MSTAALPVRRAPDSQAVILMIVLCAIWGLQQVAIKTTNTALPPVLQAGLRSLIATGLVYGWSRARGTPLFRDDGTLAAGLLAGVLFAAEFVFIFFGLTMTSASRMAVFLYTAPCFTALGLHWFTPGEKLRRTQWIGIAIAFAGMTIAFADGFSRTGASAGDAQALLMGVAGDALGVLGGIAWAATTVVVRTTTLAHASASKTLFYQLAVSAVVLLALAGATGEWQVRDITPIAMLALGYQAVVVAFVSYLAWFWLLTRYMASRLAVFSFLTPLFGVTFGVLLLGESFSGRFVGAAGLVLAGIALVNAPARQR
ncbi:DMT family transporter [Paraburkholderia caballeronis]|uniref:Permease of the drug/metabolite transporter (DMT) superfamily n=1 Tax=Paraburkholderia caballeronis TaxID=416943 RepID=A0A1H7PWV5_9BURK|nr:DMT family transporter [Paraburkholderia caballeronis]PXW24374.1 drug/metabolite transporter (DMT)-like permease [Paraburkholderia caballeronis]PXX00156.1 drug/metabolite transporter (DMT)-like permease [Paraburkholderia caballeronis]RAJ97285.1 drug/metabolite transporter (DMT)-like permease [Paraburkholderia caballeronis]SEB65791.1 Permease of the drug/metabolite transporter (DMT) superfamily [Paraburkholderia caballeronis]SEL40046.1 Permease of the drug/metabolite transporter (DMT) superf